MLLLLVFYIFQLGLHCFILFRVFYYVFWQELGLRQHQKNQLFIFDKFYFWRNFLGFFLLFFQLNLMFLFLLSLKKLVMILRGILGIGRKPRLQDLHSGKFSHYMEIQVEMTANVSRIRWAFFFQNWTVLVFFPLKFQIRQFNEEIFEVLQEIWVRSGGWNFLVKKLEVVEHSQNLIGVILVVLAVVCIFIGFLFNNLFFFFF